MRQAVSKSLLFVFLVALPVVPACGGDGGGETTHTVDKAGVFHRDGLEDPLINCVECHGADLRGGRGTNCYSCHDDRWSQ